MNFHKVNPSVWSTSSLESRLLLPAQVLHHTIPGTELAWVDLLRVETLLAGGEWSL